MTKNHKLIPFFILLFFFAFTNLKHISAEDKYIGNLQYAPIKSKEDPHLLNTQNQLFAEPLNFSEFLIVSSNESDTNISLLYPKDQLISLKSSIKIKGENKYLTDVIANTKFLSIKNDGRIYEDLELKNYGKQLVLVSFIKNDFSVETFARRILYLDLPIDIESYESNRQNIIYYHNTQFAFKNHSLNDVITRQDLANFFYALAKKPETNINLLSVNDLSSTHNNAEAISFALERDIMTEFPDGSFKPDLAITIIDYALSMVKFLKLDPINNDKELPYLDVQKDWTSKYLKAALKAFVIPNVKYLEPTKQLTYTQFIYLADKIDIVKKEIQTLTNFEVGYAVSPENHIHLEFVNNYIASKKKEIEELKRITLEYPKNHEIILTDSTQFLGNIYPSNEFKINDFTVLPEINGNFRISVPLSIGENTFSIKTENEDKELKIFFIPTFADLKQHWIEKKAAMLSYLNLIEKSDFFLPQKNISKSEFAAYIARFFNLNSTSDSDLIDAKDLTKEAPYINEISTIVKEKILTLNKENEFSPNDYITRAQALTAIIRATNYPIKESSNVHLPFKDVSSNHWAAPYIEVGLEKNIISKADKFFPNEFVSHAELVTMLSHAEYVRNKIKEVFKIND